MRARRTVARPAARALAPFWYRFRSPLGPIGPKLARLTPLRAARSLDATVPRCVPFAPIQWTAPMAGRRDTFGRPKGRQSGRVRRINGSARNVNVAKAARLMHRRWIASGELPPPFPARATATENSDRIEDGASRSRAVGRSAEVGDRDVHRSATRGPIDHCPERVVVAEERHQKLATNTSGVAPAERSALASPWGLTTSAVRTSTPLQPCRRIRRRAALSMLSLASTPTTRPPGETAWWSQSRFSPVPQPSRRRSPRGSGRGARPAAAVVVGTAVAPPR